MAELPLIPYQADGSTPDPSGVFFFAPIAPGSSDASPVVRILKRKSDASGSINLSLVVVDTGGEAEDWITGTVERLNSGGAVQETHAVSKTTTATITGMGTTNVLRVTLHASVPSSAYLSTVGNPAGLLITRTA